MVSALSSAITHVRAEEFSDIRTYNAPLVVREVMGFGLTPEQAMSGPIAALLEAGFKSSVRMVTDQLGFRAEPRIGSTQECRGRRHRNRRARGADGSRHGGRAAVPVAGDGGRQAGRHGRASTG